MPIFGNTYFPATYQPYQYAPQYQQPQYAPNAMAQPQTAQSYQHAPVQNQVQNGGFVTVRSEEEARNYPVAPGTSITFKNESAPYCYTKTMGFSQLEAPRFEKFRLVKEESADYPVDNGATESVSVEYATKEDLSTIVSAVKELSGVVSSIKGDVDSVKTDVDRINGDVYGIAGKRKTAKKQEASDDE